MYKKIKKNGKSSIYLFGLPILSYKGRTLRQQDRFYKHYEKKIKSLTTLGINAASNRQPKIIVSLTSYPARMSQIHTCLYSLLNQSLKPDMLILWLSPENFPNKEKDLPNKVLRLRKNGLSIKWCKDLKSYKKLIPTLKEFPNDIIITTDDDVLYPKSMIEKLYSSYLQFPNNIHAHWLTQFSYKTSWEAVTKKHYDEASYLNMLTGVGGVLYPPKSLHSDVLKEDLFMNLAPTNDDQWFWCQAIRNNIKTQIVTDYEQDLIYTKDSQDIGLYNINKNGPQLFWKDFKNLIQYYPELEEKLFLELNNIPSKS